MVKGKFPDARPFRAKGKPLLFEKWKSPSFFTGGQLEFKEVSA